MDAEKTTASAAELETGRFAHPANIQIGEGRIMWSDTMAIHKGLKVYPGWVIPGGRRTNDEYEARAAAKRIDSFFKTGSFSA